MADAMDNHVTVDISINSTGVPREGFGVPLIASHNAVFGERTRSYASADEVDDDFAADSPEKLLANALFSQTPRPPIVKIGRVASPVTLTYEIEATAANDLLYSLGVEGEGFDDFDAEFTSDGTATIGEIHDGLVTALNSGALAVLTFADKTVSVVDTVDNELDFAVAHGLSTGDGPVRIETTNAAPAGLAIATDYYVIAVDTDSVALATSRADALAGTRVDITGAGTGTHTLVDTADSEHVSNNYTAALAALVFADLTVSVVDTTDNELDFAAPHNLQTGDGPIRLATTNTLPAGLALATDYYVIAVDADSISLATTRANAFAGTEVDITGGGTGTHTVQDASGTKRPSGPITVTADAPGDWFSLAIPKGALSRLSMSMTHAAGTLDEDLAAILDEDDEWYTLLLIYPSKAYVLEAAAWVEANERTMVVDVPDTKAVTTPLSGATDTLAALLALNYARTMYGFHPRPGAFFSGAWMGRFLPTLPGKASPKFKNLSGVETVKLNSTQRANLIARRGNSYEQAGGRGITFEGTVGNTTFRFFDVVRNRDWLKNEVQSNVFGVEVGADIIPFTAEGIAQVWGAVRGPLFGIAQDQGVIARDPAPVVTAPRIDEVTDADKEDRELRSITADATLQGAIHKVRVVVNVAF